MATTCKLIAKNVLGSDTSSVTFSSIPGTGYTDLLVVASARTSKTGQADDYIKIQFNSSSSNLSGRFLIGTGSAASSATDTAVYVPCAAAGATASTFGVSTFYIPNYAGSTNKSVSGEGAGETNATIAIMYATAGLWSNTAAITSVGLVPYYGPNFVSGSSFFLYGITKA